MDLSKWSFDDLLALVVSKGAKSMKINKDELDKVLVTAAKKEMKRLEKESAGKANDSIEMRSYRAAARIVEGEIVGAGKDRE
jgi:hypothetical protein